MYTIYSIEEPSAEWDRTRLKRKEAQSLNKANKCAAIYATYHGKDQH